jgi:MSHA biogenesis protein MshO
MIGRRTRPVRSRGLTLIELAVTIALVGILAVMVVQFIHPVRAYIDVSRRAALADTADGALRRIRRDLRLALPNSVRVTTVSGVVYLEFLLVRVGGRYRYEAAASSTSGCPAGAGTSVTEDLLQFGAADTCFKTIGNLYNPAANISQIVNNSDYVVVFNLQPGTDKADAYQTSCGSACNRSQVTGKANLTNEDRIQFNSNTFTYESPGRRFYVIEGPVTYACDKANGTLTRYWGYAISASQPTPPGGSTALLANNVNDCLFTYDNVVSAANMGAGLVSMWLKLRALGSDGAAEDVNLYHAVHVNNVP